MERKNGKTALRRAIKIARTTPGTETSFSLHETCYYRHYTEQVRRFVTDIFLGLHGKINSICAKF